MITARHALSMLLVSLVLNIIGDFFGLLNVSALDVIWGLSSVLWNLGLIMLLYKALTYEKLREFLDR